MPWPFIHHREHQRVATELAQAQADLRIAQAELIIERAAHTNLDLQLATERARFSDLLKQFTELRIAGGQSTTEIRPSLPKAEKPTEIEQAFAIAMDGKPYGIQMAARQRLAADKELVELGILGEQELIHRILHGQETDGVP